MVNEVLDNKIEREVNRKVKPLTIEAEEKLLLEVDLLRDTSENLVNIVHKRQNHHCEECDFTSNSQETLKKHITSAHNKENIFSCKHCNFTPTTKRNLTNHMKTKHPNIPDYQCQECKQLYLSEENLNGHIKSVHSTEDTNIVHNRIKDFYCNECGKVFDSESCLREHLRTIHCKTVTTMVTKVKSALKTSAAAENSSQILQKSKSLILQGKFVQLLHEQDMDATWKSFIYDLPKGTMKYLLNASIDTLPTKTNLKRWGKRTNDLCYCGKRQTLNHILNCCNKSLTNGKYLWRHNNVLHHIKKCIDVKEFTLYIDLDENRQSRKSTIPPNAVVTTLIPDIVLIDEKTKSLEIFELTCPAETRIDIAHLLKVEKYAHLVNDIKEYKTEVNVFEIGSHTGQITKRNKECLSKLHTYCHKFIKKQTFIKNISAITMLGSYHVFNSRDEEDWVECSPILAPFKYTNQKQ